MTNKPLIARMKEIVRSRELRKWHRDTSMRCDDPPGKWILTETGQTILEAADALEAMEWKPIETAPKDGTEILLYAPGVGAPMLCRWCAPVEILTTDEINAVSKQFGGEEEWEHDSGWYYADFVHGGLLTNDGTPTKWTPLPQPETEE